LNWEQILDKYGWPTLFLALVLTAVWVIGRPVVKRLLDMIDAQLTESRAVRAKDTEEFLAALARRDNLAKEQTRAFADALRWVDEHKGRK
jgi:hypothetical protein